MSDTPSNDQQSDADDTRLPSQNDEPITLRPEPATTGETYAVPTDMVQAGNTGPVLENDSPETLDEEISKGANREDIDPDHSYDRAEDFDDNANVTNEDA